MLEIKFVRQNLSQVQKALENRGDTADLQTFKHCEALRRDLLKESEELKHQRNVASQKIAKMKKEGQNTNALTTEMRDVSSSIKMLDSALKENEAAIATIMAQLPNIPHASTPIGTDETENPVVKQFGQPPKCGRPVCRGRKFWMQNSCLFIRRVTRPVFGPKPVLMGKTPKA